MNATRGFVALDTDTHATIALLARMRRVTIGEVVRQAVIASLSVFEAQVITDMIHQQDADNDMASQRMPQ